MSEQQPKVPEQYNPHFEAQKPPAIVSREPGHDPQGRKLEDYLAQQNNKSFNPDKYYSDELMNSGFTREKLVPAEKKKAEDFVASFQKRLPDKLRGDDLFSCKSFRDKNHKLQTILPGETGFSLEDWQNTQWQIETLKKELSPEKLTIISHAKILSVEKFDRKYGVKWNSFKIVARNDNKIIVIYLLEVPRNKKLTVDAIVIIDDKINDKTEFVTRKGY